MTIEKKIPDPWKKKFCFWQATLKKSSGAEVDITLG